MKGADHTFPSVRSEEVGTYQVVQGGTFLVQEEPSNQDVGGSREDIVDDLLQEACCSIEVGIPEDSKGVGVHLKEHSLSHLPSEDSCFLEDLTLAHKTFEGFDSYWHLHFFQIEKLIVDCYFYCSLCLQKLVKLTFFILVAALSVCYSPWEEEEWIYHCSFLKVRGLPEEFLLEFLEECSLE